MIVYVDAFFVTELPIHILCTEFPYDTDLDNPVTSRAVHFGSFEVFVSLV